MSILNFATSEFDFIEGSRDPTISGTDTASRISPNVQEGMILFAGSRASGIQWATNWSGSGADNWFSFYTYNDSPGWVSTDLITMVGPTGESLFRVNGTTAEEAHFQYHNGSSWVTLYTAGSLVDSLVRFDIRLKIDSTAGAFEIYRSGAAVGSTVSGNTAFRTDDYAEHIVFRSSDNSTGNSNASVYSACFTADEDTRDIDYIQLQPNGAGTNSDWTGAYTDVDETGADDSDTLTSNTAADVSTFAMENLASPYTSGYDVVALGVSSRAKKGASGPGNLKLVCYEGTTKGATANQSLDIGRKPYTGLFHTNPDTSAEWTVSEIDAAEIGVESDT